MGAAILDGLLPVSGWLLWIGASADLVTRVAAVGVGGSSLVTSPPTLLPCAYAECAACSAEFKSLLTEAKISFCCPLGIFVLPRSSLSCNYTASMEVNPSLNSFSIESSEILLCAAQFNTISSSVSILIRSNYLQFALAVPRTCWVLCLVCLFCLCCGLTSQSTIFQSCRDGATASWVINQYFRGVKCLAQGHNTAAVGIEPPTSRSRVRHSTTEPPRSPLGL